MRRFEDGRARRWDFDELFVSSKKHDEGDDENPRYVSPLDLQVGEWALMLARYFGSNRDDETERQEDLVLQKRSKVAEPE